MGEGRNLRVSQFLDIIQLTHANPMTYYPEKLSSKQLNLRKSFLNKGAIPVMNVIKIFSYLKQKVSYLSGTQF